MFRAGYGITYNPLPWSRPLRGFYPLTIGFSQNATASNFASFPLADGIPPVPLPDTSTGRIPLPRNVETRTPNPDDVDRGRIQQWNVTVERQFPLDLYITLGYVGTRTDGGYADQNLNYAESGGDTQRQFFAQAGTANILDWAARTRSRYNGAADGDQPSVQERPAAQRRLHLGQGHERNGRGRLGDAGVESAVADAAQLRARRLRPDAHLPDGLRVRAAVCQERAGAGGGRHQELADQRHLQRVLGDAVHDCRGQHGAQLSARASRRSTRSPTLVASALPGPDEVYYDPASFAQPGNKWGNTGRNFLRGPGQWNLDLSVFKAIPFGRYRAEFRVESTECAEPFAMGQPGDRLYGSELHEGPQQPTGPPDSDGSSLPVLTLVSREQFEAGRFVLPAFFLALLVYDRLRMITVASRFCWRFSPPRPRPRSPPMSPPAARPPARP